ncbi:uncharacterized protein LOC117110092 [Anneissia japonica]|uniref:uncharacterized protein LOC117110092 n=1 Tax=Anneissia japonica TaxID=1529436 RepID=UPI00142551A9|nr:uncharacterized protein LOC117110092 [Anneissia japonica]
MSVEALEGTTSLDLAKVATTLSDQNANHDCINNCETDNANIDNDSIEPSSPRGEGDGDVTTNIDDLMDVTELPHTGDLPNVEIPVEKKNATDIETKLIQEAEVVEGEVVSDSTVAKNDSGDTKPSALQLVNDETPKSPVQSPVPQSPVPQSPVRSVTEEPAHEAPTIVDLFVDTSSIATNPSETSEDSRSHVSTESEGKQHRLMNGVPEKTKTKEPKTNKSSSSRPFTPRSNKSSLLRSLPKPAGDSKSPNLPKGKSTLPKRRLVSPRLSGSGDESANKVALTAADPIPDTQSDFKPGEFWEAKKAIAQVKAKQTLSARKDFAKSNRLFGVKSMPQDPSPPPIRRATSKASMAGSVMTHSDRSHTKFEPNPYGAAGEKYITPLQQKERQVKDLHHYIVTLEKVIDEKDLLIESFEQQKIDGINAMEQNKNEEIKEVQQTLKKSQEETEEVRQKLQETEKTLSKREEKINRLEKVINNMEQEYEEREALHQERYLEMYQKGMAAMTIEHDEDLVAGAQADPKSANIKMLLKKLEKTEMELAKVRESRRLEVYEHALPLESDSEARVELLKSAVYYFLTDKEPDNNLKTMLSMLNYSEVQKTNIKSHIKKKKKK